MPEAEPAEASLVWVTRARPAAEATAERLRAMGRVPLVDPVLEVRPLAAVGDLAGVAALAFTSANGVRAFEAVSRERGLPVFAVGAATAEAARQAGFDRVEAAGGDVRTLAAMIGGRAGGLRGEVLHLSAREPADDLSALLARRGVAARRLDVYETTEAEPASALDRLDAIEWVLAHSPKAARRLAAVLGPERAGRLAFACISENTAAPLLALGVEKVRIAAFPEEAALLKLIE